MPLNTQHKETFLGGHRSDFQFASNNWLTTLISGTVVLAAILSWQHGKFSLGWFLLITFLGTAFTTVVSTPALFVFYFAVGIVNKKNWTVLVKKAVLVLVVACLSILTLIIICIAESGWMLGFDVDMFMVPAVYTGVMIPVVLYYKLVPVEQMPEEA